MRKLWLGLRGLWSLKVIALVAIAAVSVGAIVVMTSPQAQDDGRNGHVSEWTGMGSKDAEQGDFMDNEDAEDGEEFMESEDTMNLGDSWSQRIFAAPQKFASQGRFDNKWNTGKLEPPVEQEPSEEPQPPEEQEPPVEPQPPENQEPPVEPQPPEEQEPPVEPQPPEEENPGDHNKPGGGTNRPSTKPEEDNKPGDGNKPEEGDKPGNVDKPEEPNPPAEHQHVWTEWFYKDETHDERTCTDCGSKETQEHQFECTDTQYEECDDDTHTVKKSYICSFCNIALYDETSTEEHHYEVSKTEYTDNGDGTHNNNTNYICTDCSAAKEEVTQEDCTYSEWEYVGDSTEARHCTICNNEQTKAHQHEEEPEGLEYVFSASNNNGTHKFEASYTCSICQETVTVSRNEDCEYETTYEHTGINDTHLIVNDCVVCQHHTEKNGTCVPVGEIKYVKIYAQIYEYYDCELCGDMCRRAYHTVHHFLDWEYRDSDTHIRYCGCVEGRETADHAYQYSSDGNSGTITCYECGDTKTVAVHNHGYGVYDNMDKFDLVLSEAYKEILSSSLIANPNPSTDSYCNRYDFRCRTCGGKYSVHFDHKYGDDGVCVFKSCGLVRPGEESVNLETEMEEPEDTTLLEEDNLVDAILPGDEMQDNLLNEEAKDDATSEDQEQDNLVTDEDEAEDNATSEDQEQDSLVTDEDEAEDNATSENQEQDKLVTDEDEAEDDATSEVQDSKPNNDNQEQVQEPQEPAEPKQENVVEFTVPAKSETVEMKEVYTEQQQQETQEIPA